MELSSQKLFGFVLPVGLDAELIKQSVLAGLTAVFLLAMFLFFVFPRFTDLAAAQKKVSDLEKNVNNLNRALAVLDDFRDDVSLNTKESVYLAIPTRFDPGYILLALRQLALENKVNIVSYSLGGGEVGKKEVTKGNLINHQVRLEISGAPVNLIGFVDNLDSYLPLASVSALACLPELLRARTAYAGDDLPGLAKLSGRLAGELEALSGAAAGKEGA